MMKRWMIYVLIAAAAAAIILVITLPGLMNKEPELELPVQVVNQGETLTVNLRQFVKDERVDDIVLEILEGPGELSGFSYVFEPGFSYAGEIAVRVQATDKQGKKSEDEMLINIIRVNRPPEIDTSPVVAREGEMLTIDLNSIATDPDGDELEFSVEGPGKLEGSIYSYAPGYSDSGKAVLRVLARDTQGNETARDIQLEVTDVNAPPEVRIENQIVNEGERLTVDIISSVIDEDVENLVLSIEDGPGRLEDGLLIYEPSFKDAGKKSVSIKAEDSFGNETFSSFEIEVLDVNRPPRLLLSDLVLKEGEMVEVDILSRVSEPDGDDVQFRVEGPGELVEGKYIFSADFGDAGDKSVKVFIEDEKGATNTASFTVRIENVNRAPVVSIPDGVVKEGETFRLYLRAFASDPDGDEVTFEVSEGPGSIEDGNYIFTPGFGSEGNHEVELLVTDSKGAESIGTFTVTVENVNRAPVVSIPDGVVKEGETFRLYLRAFASDPDGDEVTFEVSEGPGSIEDGNYIFTPDFDSEGNHEVELLATDIEGAESIGKFTVTVENVNRPPVKILPSLSTTIMESFTLSLDLETLFTDPDGDQLSYEVEGFGSILNNSYSCSPGYGDQGEKAATVTASDPSGLSESMLIKIDVRDKNRDPELSVSDMSTSIREGFTLKFDLSTLFSDPDGDELVFDITGPGEIENGFYSYSPDYSEAGEKSVVISATDSKGGSISLPVYISVLDANRAPVVSIPDGVVKEGETFRLYLRAFASDPDGDEVTFEVSEGPGSIEDGNYIFTPDFDSEGSHEVKLLVTDSKGAETIGNFTVTVENVNRPPVVSIPDGVVKEGETLRLYLRAFASDPDGDEVTFEISEGPGSIEDGNYIFTPGFDSEGNHEVELLATDIEGAESIGKFTVTVENVNRPPNAFIPDGTVKAGSEYSLYLRGFAGDPDGDKVAFKLVSGPGEIVDDRYLFLPERSDIGLKEIVLEISDEKGMKTETAFTLIVEANEKIVRISYGLLSVDAESIKIVAGPNEIFSTGRQAVIETDWIMNFEEIYFYEIEESQETLIGTAEFEDSSDELNRKIYSPSGTYVGNIILVTN